MSLEIHAVLTECGICRHSAGMFYTIDCIEIILKLDTSKKIKICDVYKEVGKKYGRTGNTVAVLVRNTLKTVDFSKEISRKYFGNSGKKTSEYLFDFAMKWKEENKEKEQTNEGKN